MSQDVNRNTASSRGDARGATRDTQGAGASPTTYEVEQVSGRGTGGAVFAGVLMILGGVLWALEGLAGVIKGSYFVHPQNYYIDIDPTAWGWAHLILGVLVLLAGFGVISGAVWARTVGIVLVSLSVIVNFLFLPYQPFWAIIVILIDVWIIRSLIVHGRQPA